MTDPASEDSDLLTGAVAEPVSTAPDALDPSAGLDPLTKVDITIAGHMVIVEAHRPMEDVAALAYDLIRRTAEYARRLPVGFDTGPAATQLADGSSSAESAASPSPDRGPAHL
ncbi:hypothetical protein [Actinoplanes sp. NPDC026623]|uniref:hypothetical protein n=1 Tax=Actinoplanes sp. NPDC026623 TaxID=3155610 RepID=UPI0033EBCFF0